MSNRLNSTGKGGKSMLRMFFLVLLGFHFTISLNLALKPPRLELSVEIPSSNGALELSRSLECFLSAQEFL
jgi:hypothetical protein